MRTYIRAMNFSLSFYQGVEHQNLYLEVDYQVENSQVTVKSAHFSGHDITSDLSKTNRLAIAQQIEDNVAFGY